MYIYWLTWLVFWWAQIAEFACIVKYINHDAMTQEKERFKIPYISFFFALAQNNWFYEIIDSNFRFKCIINITVFGHFYTISFAHTRWHSDISYLPHPIRLYGWNMTFEVAPFRVNRRQTRSNFESFSTSLVPSWQ